jgi:(4S)-4-hydroxy-5-phosphonooxypentane-2,3-dione isomerase
MHVTLVYVDIIPDKVAAFIEATRENHLHSIQEPGNRRFDVLRDPVDTNRFLLYEAYASEADAKAHKETDHYFAWRDKVQSMMAAPRTGVRYDGLLPEA